MIWGRRDQIALLIVGETQPVLLLRAMLMLMLRFVLVVVRDRSTLLPRRTVVSLSEAVTENGTYKQRLSCRGLKTL